MILVLGDFHFRDQLGYSDFIEDRRKSEKKEILDFIIEQSKNCSSIIILGDVGINLGDSMYDGTIFIGGKIGSFGSDAVPADLTASDQDWLKRKLKVAEIGEKFDVSKMTKIVAGKKLWNYDNLEPHEKKGAI